MTMEVAEQIDRLRVDRLLPLRIRLDYLFHAVVAEVFEQNQAGVEIARQHPRRGETEVMEMVRNGKKRPAVFMRGRRIHQHGVAFPPDNTKITAKRGISGQRQYLRP